MNLFCDFKNGIVYDERICDELDKRSNVIDSKIYDHFQGTHEEKEQLIDELNEIIGDYEGRGFTNGFYTALRFLADLHAEVSEEVKIKF